ncbi:MAG: N-acetylglucosamine-6-phosphate deacetylase [Lactovum sp.]
MTYFIKADKFFYPHHVEKGGFLKIQEGKFLQWQKESPEKSEEILDLTGYWIAPGLVETHIHGFAGADVQDHDFEGVMTTMSEGLLSAGVTSWLPSPLTADHEQLRAVCQLIGEHHQEAKGAKIQGIFFEGPFFTEEHKGAQNPKYMRDAKISELEDWQEAAKGMLKKIGLAPERQGAIDFIREATKQGVVVALGHSNASYQEAVKGVEAGGTIWVHGYNGMSGLNHREPGMVGAMLNTDNTYAELICDGYHVRPEAAEILIKMKGTDHVVLITDSMRAAGFSDGTYKLGEYDVEVRDGAAWLETGNLAASILKLSDAIKNVVDWGIVTPEEAVKMATFTAAKSVNIEDKCGQIKQGHAADFIVLNPQMELQSTYLNGEKSFQI